MYLIGRYYHALEQKGRLSIPAPFRTALGKTALLTTGLDGCLFMFADDKWEQVAAEAEKMSLTKRRSRDWVRYLANSATSVNFDSLGRVLVPEHLRNLAGLKKQVVIVGSLNRVEIWDQAAYHTYFESLEDKAEELAESIEIEGPRNSTK